MKNVHTSVNISHAVATKMVLNFTARDGIWVWESLLVSFPLLIDVLLSSAGASGFYLETIVHQWLESICCLVVVVGGSKCIL